MFKRRNIVSCGICAAIGLIAAKGEVAAQGAPGFSRKIIQKTEYPGDKYVCVLVEVEIDPGVLVARHRHPGVESSYVVSGSSTLSVKGQPDRVLNAGDGFQIPAEVPHSVKNGNAKTKVVATYIVEKDKPLASPAPE